MTVKENLTHLKSTLSPEITLVAVSKTKPVQLVMEAYNAGQRDFGENYVQELVEKHELLPKDIHWHFIGHLQSNKVKYLAPFVHLIHGVDSLSLLKEISKQAVKNNRVISCLLQVYIAREESKFGFEAEEVRKLIASGILLELPQIKITGLMGMASNSSDQSLVRSEFEGLATLFRELKKLSVPGVSMEYLSCGMSSDYWLALAAGSNMLRIGSTIFGLR